MMDQLTLISAYVAAALLPLLFYGTYRDQRVRLLRDRLFAIRDNLFLEWARSGRPFDERAYVMTRNSLNGMLRFAHNFNLVYLALIVFTGRKHRARLLAEHEARWAATLAQLDDDLRAMIERTQHEAVLALLSHSVHVSLPFATVIAVLKLLPVKIEFSAVVERAERTAPEVVPAVEAYAEQDPLRRFGELTPSPA